MRTKLLMTLSTIFLGASGLVLSFMPQEVLTSLEADANSTSVLVLQLLGSMYIGFALLNWMTKGSRIGGIYNKPVSAANFAHFFIGAITLIKSLFEAQNQTFILISFTIIYSVFALSFAYVSQNNPKN